MYGGLMLGLGAALIGLNIITPSSKRGGEAIASAIRLAAGVFAAVAGAHFLR